MSSYFEIFINKLPFIKKLKKGAFIIARVLQIKNKFIILDANLKSEVYIPIKEFLNKQNELEVSKGDYIDLFIESLDSEKGILVLSRVKLRDYISRKLIENNFRSRKLLIGVLFKKIKGGFIVFVKETKCFLPFSGTDKKILLNNYYYEKKKLLFKIVSFNKQKNNIILNRKIFLKKIFDIKKGIFIKKFLKRGLLIKGVVKNIISYGVFIDLGYADGIILSKNVSWMNKKHSNQIIRLNQCVILRVLEVDKNLNRIFLSLKNIIKDPWITILHKYKIGYIKYARVYKVTSDTFYFILEKGVYSNLKKIIVNRFFNYKKNINKIKVNSYIKVVIKSINLKEKNVNVQIIWFYS